MVRYAVLLTLLCLIYGVPSTLALPSAHPRLLYQRGDAILNQYSGNKKMLADAEAVFDDLVQKWPQSPYGYLGLSHVQRINAYRYGNRYNMMWIRNHALPLAVEALELGPSIEEVHENYAVFEKIFQDHYRIQENVRGLLDSSPQQPETFWEVAEFMLDKQEVEKAVSYYQLILELDSDTRLKFQANKKLAWISAYLTKDFAAGLDYAAAALEYSPASPEIKELQGFLYFKQRNYDAASAAFSEALSASGSETAGYYLLVARGLMTKQQGKLDDAIDKLQQAAGHWLHDSTAHLELGRLYFDKEDYQEALAQFQTAIRLSPREAVAYFFAGRSAELIGEKSLAMEFYRKILRLQSEGDEADWVRANVPELSHR